MHEFIDLLKQLNIPTLLTVIGACWWFTRDIKKEIKSIHVDMEKMREDMYKEFKFVNIRLSRVEGTVYGKDIYKNEKN